MLLHDAACAMRTKAGFDLVQNEFGCTQSDKEELRMRCTLYRRSIARPHQASMPHRPGSKFHDTVGESPVRCGERVGVK